MKSIPPKLIHCIRSEEPNMLVLMRFMFTRRLI